MLPTVFSRTGTASPFDALDTFRRDLERLWSGLPVGGRDNGVTWSWPTDIQETSDEIRLMIEAPGFRPEDFEITLENQVLTVSAEKKFETEGEQERQNYLLYERRYGRFQRSFMLPRNVDMDKVVARYENGVLYLVLPKLESAKPRRIQIQGAGEARRIESGKAD